MLKLDSVKTTFGKTVLFTNGEKGYFLPVNFPKNWSDSEKNNFAKVVSEMDISLSTAVFCLVKAFENSEEKNIIELLKHGYIHVPELSEENKTETVTQTIVSNDATKIDQTVSVEEHNQNESQNEEIPETIADDPISDNIQEVPKSDETTVTEETLPNIASLNSTSTPKDVIDQFNVSEGMLGASANAEGFNNPVSAKSEDLAKILTEEKKKTRPFANPRNLARDNPEIANLNNLNKELLKDTTLTNKIDFEADNKNLVESLVKVEEEANVGVVDPNNQPVASQSAINQNLGADIANLANSEAQKAEEERKQKEEEEKRLAQEKEAQEEKNTLDEFKNLKANKAETTAHSEVPPVLKNETFLDSTSDNKEENIDETKEEDNNEKVEVIYVNEADLTFKEKLFKSKKALQAKYFILMTTEEKESFDLGDYTVYNDKIEQARALKWDKDAITQAFFSANNNS